MEYLFSVKYFYIRILISLILLGLVFIGVCLCNGKINLSGIITKSKGNKKLNQIKSYALWEKRFNNILKFCERLDSFFLFSMSLNKQDQYDYAIRRFNFKLPYVLRSPSSKEFSGFCKLVALLLSITGVVLFEYTLNPIFLVAFASFFLQDAILLGMNIALDASDKAIEEDFPDLYLFLCPSLLKGSDCHITNVLSEYLGAYESVRESHKDIVNLVICLQSLISTYGSELEAIKHLRDYYHTPAVVNFVNISIQALNGIDNRQKLLAYKEELCHRNLELMDAKGKALCERGSRIIWLVFIILGEFVVLSWLAKCGISIPSEWILK